MTRASLDVRESWVIIRGLLGKGIQLYGPFPSLRHAQEYGDKKFPDDTREFITMIKEETTHGEE